MASSNHDLRIAIVGAGMGGLTAALALAKRGFKNIDVYESASNLGFVGAGIQLAPNMGRSKFLKRRVVIV
jgi:salicylate hydroxylase